MSKELVHTPEGVRDIYGSELSDRSEVQNKVHEVFRSFGYEDMQTPTFEFLDVFAKEINGSSSKELYKFFDKEGETLVLRPDFTPSIARCAAKYFADKETSQRICYSGSTFTNTGRLQGKLHETMQMGAELINDSSIQADAEMIAMLIQSLLASGLKDFQISVGDADYFKGICEEAGIDENTEEVLREQIAGKNIFAAEKILTDRGIDGKYADLLLKVSEYVGSVEELDKAVSVAGNERSIQAVDRLKSLYEVLKLYGIEKYVSFDLSMLNHWGYYTGVIYRAYTYGVGDAIAKGGRYDNLLAKFGRPSPAIGFVIAVDDLMNALHRQNISLPAKKETVVLEYDEGDFEQQLKEAQKLRSHGDYVVLRRKESV